MNELVVADRASEWRRLKALVLDSVSSPITRRVYNLGLDEFIAWFGQEPRVTRQNSDLPSNQEDESFVRRILRQVKNVA